MEIDDDGDYLAISKTDNKDCKTMAIAKNQSVLLNHVYQVKDMLSRFKDGTIYSVPRDSIHLLCKEWSLSDDFNDKFASSTAMYPNFFNHMWSEESLNHNIMKLKGKLEYKSNSDTLRNNNNNRKHLKTMKVAIVEKLKDYDMFFITLSLGSYDKFFSDSSEYSTQIIKYERDNGSRITANEGFNIKKTIQDHDHTNCLNGCSLLQEVIEAFSNVQENSNSNSNNLLDEICNPIPIVNLPSPTIDNYINQPPTIQSPSIHSPFYSSLFSPY